MRLSTILSAVAVVLTLAANALTAQTPTIPTDTTLAARAAGDSLGRPAPAPAPRDPARQSRFLFQPTVTSYTFGEGSTARTVEQAALPVVLGLPFHPRLTVDVTTAAAYTRVISNDSTESEIVGSTDTQIRADWQLMLDHLSLTLGVNAPSGQYRVKDDQIGAATRIGDDFLLFPIASMGNGPAGTIGLAAAVELFHINVGFGGSYRKGTEFEPVSLTGGEVRYQPADETRFRLSGERRLWIGTASFGMIFSSFGEEKLDATTYSTGDRVITTAGWSIPLGRLQVDLGLWNIDRDAGERFGGPAPAEAIRNYSGAVSLRLGQWVLQPMMEIRRATVSGDLVAELSNIGINISIPIGQRYVLEPRYLRSTGTLYVVTSSATVPMTGWQGSLLLRRR